MMGTTLLLVDQLISCSWRWRRVVGYETMVVGEKASSTILEWEQKLAEGKVSVSGIDSPESRQQLEEEFASVARMMAGLAEDDPLATSESLRKELLNIALEKFGVSDWLLGYQQGADAYRSYEKVQRVIAAVCEKRKISESQFWEAVDNYFLAKARDIERKLGSRREEHRRQLLMASLPDEPSLSKIQRYEAHLSRQFYKALHELQRLQVARLISQPTAPLAVDIDLHTDSSV